MTAPTSYTASAIITDALQKLAIYAPGDTIPDSDLARGLVVLNDMLDQWQNENLFVFSLTALTLNLSNGTPTYTIGPLGTSANLTSGRPQRVQQGPGAASLAYGGTTYNVNVVSALEWSGIQSISPGVGVPDTLFYDPQYPVGVLNVAPTPNQGGMVLTFYQLTPFTSFALYTTSAAFSQGTADALKSNLAVFAKPYFASAAAQIDPIIVARAETSKEFLRNTGTTSLSLIKRSPSRIGRPSNQAASA